MGNDPNISGNKATGERVDRDKHGPPESVADRERHSKNELIAEIQLDRKSVV